jgi:hypothetical protein
MISREITDDVVVVLAFRTVYTLELKRRDNEKKVIALYVEMKDMMGILLLSVVTFTYRVPLADLCVMQPRRRAKRQGHRA